MTHPSLRFAALLLTACVAACGSAPDEPMRLQLLQGSWQFAGPVPAGARLPTLTLAPNGTVQGNAGINSFRGTIDKQALLRGVWRMGSPQVTKMGGTVEAMAFESRFVHSLTVANAVVTQDGHMLLREGDTTLLEFERLSFR